MYISWKRTFRSKWAARNFNKFLVAGACATHSNLVKASSFRVGAGIFARVHQLEGSLRTKRWHDMRTVASTFGRVHLVWLHNPQRNKGISPKMRRAWEGPIVVVERLSDVQDLGRPSEKA